MALADFYMQPTGSNLNSGSSSGDAADHTYASGNLATSGGVATFTVASGDPQADGVQVGDRVSIYPDGSSVTPFVGTVTAVTSTTIACSSTVNKFGTIPTDGTGNRTLKVGGAWADLGITASGCAFNTGTTNFGLRINVKAGTYANGGTSRTLALAGATTAPIVWRGYKTTPGDMDSRPASTRVAGTDIPSWTFDDANLTSSGGHQTFENIDIVGARSAAAQFVVSGNLSSQRFKRLRVENTNAAAASSAVSVSGSSSSHVWFECWFKATSSATRVFQGATAHAILGCVCTGGGIGFEMSVGQPMIHDCLIISTGSHGIQSSLTLIAIGNTFYNCGGDSIRITAFASTTISFIANNVFSLSGGYDINNSSGTATNFCNRVANISHSPTSGHENGFGDSPNYYAATDASSPFTNAGTGDFSLAGTSNANGGATPGLLENNSNESHGSCGAVQPEAGGAADYPAVGNVRDGVSYASGTMTGTLTVPAAGDVQSGVQFGAGGTEYTGTFAAPAASDVRSGTGYGAAGTEFTGTCAVPAASNVKSGVSVDATTGTLTQPAVTDVKLGTQYGSGGNEFTGSFIVAINLSLAGQFTG